jgi:hypothetical protein
VTVSDLFDLPVKPKPVPETESKGTDTSARDARARIPATQSDGKVVGRAGRIKAVVVTDFKRSWLWDERGPTIRNLIANLMPAAERVPTGHAGLRWAWIAYSYLTFVALVPLLFACWVLCHPARLLYLAPVAAPLFALWING